MRAGHGLETPGYYPILVQPDVKHGPEKRRKPDEKARKHEVVLLKDLAPRKDVKGGAKLRFGEAQAGHHCRPVHYHRRRTMAAKKSSSVKDLPRKSVSSKKASNIKGGNRAKPRP